MSSLIAQVADAVAAELNAGAFSLSPLGAVRKWLVDWRLEELATLHVAVTMGPSTWEFRTRALDEQRHTTDVVAQQRVDPTDNAEADALVAFLEELVGHFRGRTLSAGSSRIICLERTLVPGNAAAVDRALLDNPHVFTAVLRLQWLVK
jgi:hypothetical protein